MDPARVNQGGRVDGGFLRCLGGKRFWIIPSRCANDDVNSLTTFNKIPFIDLQKKDIILGQSIRLDI